MQREVLPSEFELYAFLAMTGKRDREEVDGDSCESDDNFWSESSAADSSNRRSVESNGEKSAAPPAGRPTVEDGDRASTGEERDGALIRQKGDGLSTCENLDGASMGHQGAASIGHQGDGASEGGVRGRRQQRILQVRSYENAGLGRQSLQEAESPVHSNPSRGPSAGERSLGSGDDVRSGDHPHARCDLSAQRQDRGPVRAAVRGSRGSVGTGRNTDILLQSRIGGTIITEEGTSSSPHSNSSKGSHHTTMPSPHIQGSQDSKNSLQEKNIDEILEEREWEVRNVGNWLDGEGEEFLREYNDLPLPPTKGPQLREREPAHHPPLRKPPTSPKSKKESQNRREKKKKRQME